MSRSSLLVVAVAMTAGAIGCAHCTTCDDFPTSCAAGGIAYGPTAGIAPGPLAGPYLGGPIMEGAAPPASPYMMAPAPSPVGPEPASPPGPFTPPAIPDADSTRSVPPEPVSPSTDALPEAPADSPPARPADALTDPGELDLSLPGTPDLPAVPDTAPTP